MPHRSSLDQVPPADPREWRPQRPRPRRSAPAISNALVEPLWEGIHVIVHWERGEAPDALARLALIDEIGEEVEEDETGAVLPEQLRQSMLAGDAVIDGYLTRQASRPGAVVSTALVPQAGSFNPIFGPRVEVGTSPLEESRDAPLAFVAVDLLRVDGETLLDVPLLERKRLLDGVLAESELIRVSPYTQPPIDQWLSTWSAAGFRGVMLKAANSRYRPGEETDEWTATLAHPGR